MTPSRGASPVVSVRNLSKVFAVPHHHSWTIQERLRHPVESFRHERLQALEDVSFEVAPGEFFGVIGRNGSGKSTLLRCIAGIHVPDRGEVEVHARIAPFIELGVGFHPQLAAADNVLVAGTLMGLRPAEARRRFPSVIGFAELEEYLELPIANYSSGMQVRLAFSTSFQVDAELLLFDEVMAVGDAVFRRKTEHTFNRLTESGHTIVYVSHSLETVKKFADRALLLDRGRVAALGEPAEVIEEYERRNREYERARDRVELVSEPTLIDWEVPQHRRAANGHPSPISRPQRFADIVFTLARQEFKVRYLDSLVGYLWSLAQPLLLFLVLYLVWATLFKPGTHVPHYKQGLLLGIALFTFFGEATSGGLVALVNKGTMLRKIPFPALTLPAAAVLTSFIVYSITLVVVSGFIIVSGVTPSIHWLEMLPVLVLLLAFTLGTSLTLSMLYVRARDIQWIWSLVNRLLFFLTPVFYSIQLVPKRYQPLVMVNPLSVVTVQARHAMIDPSGPSALQAAGPLALGISLGLTAATIAAGLLLYRRQAPRVAEWI
jgi:ABC-type polysaccharide/polyol phosphate transport system ATPase subunit/ABC-type polysaccharide/polyol phosphate export permease